jgi:hypothetical protein
MKDKIGKGVTEVNLTKKMSHQLLFCVRQNCTSFANQNRQKIWSNMGMFNVCERYYDLFHNKTDKKLLY